jgi:hypothetical protein
MPAQTEADSYYSCCHGTQQNLHQVSRLLQQDFAFALLLLLSLLASPTPVTAFSTPTNPASLVPMLGP